MDKKKILVVEDETPLLNALCDKLNKENFEAYGAKNGLEGLEMIKTNKPHLIIMDVVMPVMDGLTMLYNLKTDPEMKDIPVIILSNLSDSEDILKAMERSTYDYLIKSDVSLEEVVSRIKNRLGMI